MIRSHLARGKQLMEEIRAGADDMPTSVRALLDTRIADMNAIRVRDDVSVALALVAALLTRFLAW